MGPQVCWGQIWVFWLGRGSAVPTVAHGSTLYHLFGLGAKQSSTTVIRYYKTDIIRPMGRRGIQLLSQGVVHVHVCV